MTTRRSNWYWEPEPSSRSRPRAIRVRVPELTKGLLTDAGVFSNARVDLGTEAFLQKIPAPPQTGDIVDLGSGYGPISITVALRAPETTVWAVDVNTRALGLVEENAALYGLTNVVPSTPDRVPDRLLFDVLYTNPPVRIGKEPLRDLLLEWLARLKPDGVAYFVVKRNLGADSLAKWLGEHDFIAERMASRRGYRILSVRPQGAG